MNADLSPVDLLLQLLYRVEDQQARFATWRMTDGHEAVAIFATGDAATKYCAGLTNASGWTLYQPSRDKLVEILRACRSAGIYYAALDPIDGNAKTLFDIPRVLAAALNPESKT